MSGVIKKIELKPGTGLQCLGAQLLWRQEVEEGGLVLWQAADFIRREKYIELCFSRRKVIFFIVDVTNIL